MKEMEKEMKNKRQFIYAVKNSCTRYGSGTPIEGRSFIGIGEYAACYSMERKEIVLSRDGKKLIIQGVEFYQVENLLSMLELTSRLFGEINDDNIKASSEIIGKLDGKRFCHAYGEYKKAFAA